MALTLTSNAQKEPYLLVGTYTSGTSEGIYVFRFNTDSGTFQPVSHVKTSNPSFLAVTPNEKYVYAVNENADSSKYMVGGSVAAFSFDKKTGVLAPINTRESGGKHPCYVSVDKSGKWVFAGNYSSGSFAMLKIQPDGGLDAPKQIVQHEGSGVNSDRQSGPHVHATVVSPDNKYLMVPDLGLDKVMIYGLNTKSGSITPAKPPFQMTEAGAGPRHLDFSPNGKFAYLMEEMSGSISVYAYSKGTLKLIQNISALPVDFTGDVGSADIHVSPDGKFLYASNRGGSNNIAIFSVDAKSGELRAIGHQPTLGNGPRNFNFDPTGNFLLVANQNTDEIVIFKRDKVTGLLNDTGKRIGVSKPVCVKWIE